MKKVMILVAVLALTLSTVSISYASFNTSVINSEIAINDDDPKKPETEQNDDEETSEDTKTTKDCSKTCDKPCDKPCHKPCTKKE